MIRNYFYLTLLAFGFGFFSSARAQTSCAAIFPGPVQNYSTAGRVQLNWLSQVSGASGNMIYTTDLRDDAGPILSCASGDCIETDSLVPTGTYTGGYPGGPNINLGWGQSTTISPGSYGNVNHIGNGTITMQPGVYTFSGTLNTGNSARFVVASPGTVAMFFQGNVTFGDVNRINDGGINRYVFIHTPGDIYLDNGSSATAIFYSGDDVTVDYQTQVTGAITARDDLILINESRVNYNSTQVSNTNFNGFCSNGPVTPPTPIADWRLEENTWSGNANEIVDSSSNNLHGRSVAVNGNHPTRVINTPVVAGDPGTCYYGNFNGVNDGYLRIDDPGTNSILDLNNEFAVAVWIYPRTWATSDLMSIVSKDENFEFHLNGSGQVNWWWGGGNRELTTAASVGLNAWHHIVISYRNGEQIIYIDGVNAATRATTEAITLNNDPVLIGTDLDFNNRNFNGLIDEVKIYNQRLSAAEVSAIMAQTHPCVLTPAIDHFVIDVGGGSASTCAPYEVTITAEDANNNTLTAYTGTIGITTSTSNGNWSVNSANGNFSPGGNDSGSASYDFEVSGGDNGVITLDLANQHTETLTITVIDAVNGVTSTSGNLSFSENAFVINATDSLANDVIANRSHNFQVAMMREDPSTGVCSVATNYNVATVKAWLTRGAGDPGGVGPQVSNATVSDSEILGNAEPPGANFTLPFVNGVADFSLLASDVGRYALNFQDDSLSFSDQDISGSSSTFVARPFGFAVSALGNPGANNASGAVFTSAGSDFSVTVRAVGWESGDDNNNDGIPDGHADLSNNLNLVSFGNEIPGESVQLSSALVAPGGGNDPGLGDSATAPGDGRLVSSFSNGVGNTNDVYFSEVGIIELNATVGDGNYLGAGATFTSRASGRSSSVGRFTPAQLSVIPGSINEACGSGLNFSYMGQAFEVEWQLEARNAFDALTMNYEGAFAKLDSGNGSLDFAARDAVTPTYLSSRLNHNLTNFAWSAGTGSLISNIQIARAVSPDGPYDQLDIGGLATDGDGVTVSSASLNLDEDNDTSFDHVNLGQTEVRFGRLRLADSFGPETANLPVDFQTQYWNGSLWTINLDDSCTTIDLDAISYPNGPISTVANRTVSVGSSNSTGIYASLGGAAVNFTNGDADHYFTSPGTGNMGEITVDVNLALYPWLRFDWNQDGDYSDTLLPTASFTFGSYRGHDRVIFWQELLR